MVAGQCFGTGMSVRFEDGALSGAQKSHITDIASRGGQAVGDSLRTMLADWGYLDNMIVRTGDTLSIAAGEQYRIGSLSIRAVYPDGEIIEAEGPAYGGLPAGKDILARMKQDILDRFLDTGHYFASLVTDSVQVYGSELSLYMRMIVGPEVTVRRVRFKGLKKTRPEFLRKLIDMREGSRFSDEKLRAALDKLNATGFVQCDSLPVVTANENYNGVEVLFPLSEQKSTSLELGGGYVPRSGDREGEFVGHLDFRSRNLFGSGRTIDLLLSRKDRYSSETALKFMQPLFIPDHLDISLDVSQVDYDSSYHSFSVAGKLGLYLDSHSKLTAAAAWARMEPQNSSQPAVRYISGIAGYETSRLDFAPNPARGYSGLFEISYIQRTVRADSLATTQANAETAFTIDAESYLHVAAHMVVRVHGRGQVRITPRRLIDYSEQYKLGGFGSLRGYRDDQFAGRQVFLGQAEVRWRFSREFTPYIFTDIGHVYVKREVAVGVVESEDITRIGSGAGVFVGSATARMTLELGWGRHDSLGDGKIHLRLVTLF